MTPYELLDLALSLNDRIDLHWTLFITVHLALIGGIIYVDRPLVRAEKIAAIFIYTGFALINAMMMNNQIDFLDNIYQEIYLMKDGACCTTSPIIHHVASLYEAQFSARNHMMVSAVHISMFIVVILSILYDTALPKDDVHEDVSDSN